MNGWIPELYALAREGKSVADIEAMSLPDWFKYRYDVTVGCIVSGPDYAADALQVQATQIIGHHIYGEVEEMLRDLFRAACEEGASMELRDQISGIISECRALG